MQKVLLVILDGWGIAPLTDANIFTRVTTPFFDHLVSSYPITALSASGPSVGLADGEVGNSEAGHWNLGTGQRFRPEIWSNARVQSTTSLGSIVSRAGKKQYHISETEKYVHATYFFNGGHASPFIGEDDTLVPSPKVSSYDEKPAMSVKMITRRLVQTIEKNVHDFLVVNYPNLDIVAHTGNVDGVAAAVKIIDHELKIVTTAALNHGYTMIVTADHGNIECMVKRATDMPHRAHTLAPVPCIIVRKDLEGKRFRGAPAIERDLSGLPVVGELRDVPVTILDLMGIEKPMGMEGLSLCTLLPPE